MAINLTKVYGRINNVRKKLFYGKDANGQDRKLQLYHGNELLAEITDGWYISTSTISDFIEDLEYFEITIADINDAIDLDNVMLYVNRVIFDGNPYKVSGRVRPRGATRVWELKVDPIISK